MIDCGVGLFPLQGTETKADPASMTHSADDQVRTLNLDRLGDGMPGISGPYGQSMAEAAAVCLDERGHQSGIEMMVSGSFQERFRLVWRNVTEQMRRSWADQEFATEHGAYGIAALLTEALTSLTIIERSRKGTGFDYWLGSESSGDPLFQAKARLEVSGIRWSGPATIRARVKQKLTQVQTSNSTSLPALVIVVEFGKPQAQVVRR